MKKFLMTLALGALTSSAWSQQVNGTFDGDANWENCHPWDSKGGYSSSSKGKQPKGWRMSHVAAAGEVGGKIENEDGYAVNLKNFKYAGQLVPAYITLGTPWATAVTIKFTEVVSGSADGGTWGGLSFSYKPDAISFDYKRDCSHGKEKASVIAYMWKGTFTQKDVPGNTAVGIASPGKATKCTMTNRDRHVLDKLESWNLGGATDKTPDAELVASLNYAITESTNGAWVKGMVIPFNYANKEASVSNINIIFAANDYFGDRSKIVPDNSLTIDNVVLLYYHALSSLKYDNKALPDFAEDKYHYDLSSEAYDESKLSYVKKGVGASVETSYDDASALLTITVKGNDYDQNKESLTTYTIQFQKTASTIYKNSLLVDAHDLNEGGVPQLTEDAQIKLTHNELKDSYDLLLEDFSFGSINVGNIFVKDVAHTTKDGVVYLKEDAKEVEVNLFGEVVPLPLNVDAILNGSSLVATIVIPLNEETNVDVTFAPLYEATPAKALTIPANGLGNVTFSRTFYKGWNTFVAPFPVTKKQLGFEKVNALAAISTSAGWLKFDDVADETLEANKPYLLYYSADQTPVEFYYGGTVLSTTGEVKATATAHNDAKVSMVGNYKPQSSIVVGNYLLTELSGEDVIVKAGSKATVDATKCYFTFENVPNPAALSVKFGGDVTGMGNVVAEETVPRANGVYNLQGVKLSNGSVEGLPAGLYIVNGRKVLVK